MYVILFCLQLTFTARSLDRTYGKLEYGQDCGISYLPLSHIAAQVRAHRQLWQFSIRITKNESLPGSDVLVCYRDSVLSHSCVYTQCLLNVWYEVNRQLKRQNGQQHIPTDTQSSMLSVFPAQGHVTSFTNSFIWFSLQMTDIYLPLMAGATVYFAQPDALKVSLSLSCIRTKYPLLPYIPPPASVYLLMLFAAAESNN